LSEQEATVPLTLLRRRTRLGAVLDGAKAATEQLLSIQQLRTTIATIEAASSGG
jgi:hypothetical protein